MMRSDSDIMTEIAHKTSILKRLNDDESRKLKSTLLYMLENLDSLCKKNGLDLILVGGSALGAARHKGFIPWDDDLDVALSREHYDKLISLLEKGELGDEYDFTVPSKSKDSKNVFLKIYLRNTINSEIHDLYTPFPKGIYIDVFPIENAYPPGILNQLKSIIAKTISFLSVSVLYWENKSKEYRDFMYQTEAGRRRYKLRMFTGLICSFLSHKRWVKVFDSFVKKRKPTGFLTIPSGRKGYSGETLRYEAFFPAKEIFFENILTKVPSNLDLYLKNLYGNYMEIPPVEKRERHYISNIVFRKDI